MQATRKETEVTNQEATQLVEMAACPEHRREKPTCPDCGTATMAIHADGSQTCGHCYMKRAYDLGVLTGRRPREYR
jgi:ribosomal protein S27AE